MEMLLAVELLAACCLAEVVSELLIALSEEGAEKPRVAEVCLDEPSRSCPEKLARLLEVSLEEQEVVPEMEQVSSSGL